MKLKYISIALLATTLVSCEDFLDKQPPSYVIPEDYYQIQQVSSVPDCLTHLLLITHYNHRAIL